MIEPVISIICNTYNQEKYISQALDSFLMQKVSVPFEILVHDDASTDGTTDIVRMYAEKYPDIIKPLIQTENMYAKGISITHLIQIPRAKGKYIAFCEGDDYWTDETKLQTQYDFLEQRLEYSACCHAYDMVDREGELIKHCNDANHDGEMRLEQFIGSQLEVPQLATFFFKREHFEDTQGYYLGRPINDMVLRIKCCMHGKVYYFNKNMSAYRRFVEGSWTMRVGMNAGKMAESIASYIPFLEQIDELTDGSYHDAIVTAIDQRKYQAGWLMGDYKAMIRCKTFKKENLKKRIVTWIGVAYPSLADAIRKRVAA